MSCLPRLPGDDNPAEPDLFFTEFNAWHGCDRIAGDPFNPVVLEEAREKNAALLATLIEVAKIDRKARGRSHRRCKRPTFPPIGLNRVEAAKHVGVAVNSFDKMVQDGVMPEPGRYGRRKFWHRPTLDAALAKLAGNNLPAMTLVADEDQSPNPWDTVLQ